MQTISPSVEDPLFWQWHYRKEVQSCETLAARRDRVKDEVLRAALWDGAYALKEQAKASANSGHRKGALLTMFVDKETTQPYLWQF